MPDRPPTLGLREAVRAPLDFDSVYSGTPGWDIGRPQPAMLSLAQSGAWRGRLLDIGCGTGEHALLAASLGLDATGVDLSPEAIGQAARKASDRRLPSHFVVGDALDLGEWAPFDTVVDSGLFHVFEDDQRVQYVKSLHSVLRPGGSCWLLCFSDRQNGGWPPRRVSREEIPASFAGEWHVDWVYPATFELNGRRDNPDLAFAWLAKIDRC